MMTRAAPATPHCADAGTRMDALFAALQIDSSQWHASSCNDRLCLIPTSARLQAHKAALLLGQDDSCFSVRPAGRFSVPTCAPTLRRAQRRSRLAGGHRRRRRNAVLTDASTARTSIRSGSATNPDQVHHVSGVPEPTGPAHRGVTAPLLFRLPDGRKSHQELRGLRPPPPFQGVASPEEMTGTDNEPAP